MNDILLSIDDFEKRKDRFKLDEQVRDRYQKLFSKYECFNKLVYFHKGTTTSKHLSEATPRVRKSPMSYTHERKSPKKTLTMLWNTLNESNYTKISHRLRFMVNHDNINTVMQELVQMAIFHSIYKKYFVLLLKDVLAMASPRDSAIDILKKIIVSFDKSYFILDTNDRSASYDDFCKQQKHKHKVSSTIEFLIDATTMDALDFKLNTIWEKLASYYIEVSKEDPYYYDILLHCIGILVEKGNTETIHTIKHDMYQTLSQLRDCHTNKMKLVFLSQKIFKLLQ